MHNNKFIAGEYQIEKTLDRSQYSVFCLGKESATGRLVLLKLWLTAQVDSEEAQTRVRAEVAALQSIKHPHLLPILEVQADAQKVFLVSEYASEGSLNERLGQEGEEAFSLDEALQIIEQVGQALQELHTYGITHGNLTPQAVFFSEPGQVQLGEFLVHSVLVRIRDYQHILDENVPRCLYMAPEQFHGTLDPKTDQYALGCLAYVLLTGRVPFAGSARSTLLQKHQRDEPQALTAINPAVPAHIEAAVLRSLAKNPQERYSSVRAFLEDLDASGKKMLADQNTLKQPTPGPLLKGADVAGGMWEWEVAVPSEEPLEDSRLASVGGGSAPRPLLVQFPVGQPHSGQSARSSRKQGQYVIGSVVLLVLALLFVTGRWLVFSGGSGSTQLKRSATSVTSASVLLTPTTAMNAQGTTTATVTAIQIPTPTPTSAPRSSVTPNPVTTATPTPIQVPLASFFNNGGIGGAPGQANFDGSGYSYPADQLPSGGQITVKGVPYRFPGNALGTNDNIIASGQTIPLTPGKYRQAFLLAAASWGPISGTVTIRYIDGSTATTNVTVLDWYNGPSNGLSTTDRYSPDGIDRHAVYIYVIPIKLDATRIVNALMLPGPQSGPHQNGHIHMFALTLLP